MGAKSLVFSLTFFILFLNLEPKVIQPNTSPGKDGKGSLVFVFDTTGSMFNDLRQLREGAEMILKTAMEDSHVIADFVFVPFHDPRVGPATVTKDKEVFKKTLASYSRLYGGGNCPEMSLTGIQLALNVSRPRSFIYVFTDATAYDHKLVGKVLDAVQRKQSQVVFVLTGHCNDLDKPTFKVYPQIAAASSGQVFNLNKTSVHKVLEFVRSSIKGRSVNLASAVNPAGYNYTQEIPVDKSVDEVTVSVSGAKPQIRVVNPSGTELTGPPQLVTTLDLSEIMIIKVLKPEPGHWSITVGSEEEHSVRVVGMSNLTFQHGFSVQPATSMDETSYRPLKGTYNHLLISLNGTDAPLLMDQVQLLTLDGKPFFEVPLKELDRKLYLADAFVPPDDFFNIAMIGHDENGQEVRRIGSTAVQAKPPDAPYVVVTEKIVARAHTQVKLTCHVESLVPLSVVWTKDGVQLSSKTHTLQSTSIKYVIEDMSEGYVGKYTCIAKNAAGSSRASTALQMVVDPPQVTISPLNVTLTENDTLTLSCSVFSEALLQRAQIVFNGTLQSYAIDIHLEPTMDGYYNFNKTIQHVSDKDRGIYTCVAANKGGKTNQSSDITVQLKPTVQILGQHTLNEYINSDIKLVCNVENAEKVKWLDINNNIVKEKEINESYSAVLDIKNVTEDDAWTCLAMKNSLQASDTVTLTVLIKPRVKIESPKNITILNGTVHVLTCTVVAKPAPRILWRVEPERFLINNVTNPEPNLFMNTLTLDSTKESINGTYFCVAENSEGVEEDNITVKVRTKMTVLQRFSDTSVELYSQIDFHCLFDSDPPSNITWYHNGTSLRTDDNINISEDNTIINIQKVDFDDLGPYVCEADNGYEKMAVNGLLSVHGLERPTISKENVKITALRKKSAKITCRVLKGNPEPNIHWQYRRKTSTNFTSLPENVKIDEDKDINIDEVTKDNEGIYKCIADNVIGSDWYDVELVAQYPPEFNVSQESQLDGIKQVKVGNKLELTCNVSGIPPPIIVWTKDDLPITYSSTIYLSEDYRLVINNITKFDSGTYVCNASNALGFAVKNFNITAYKYPEIEKPELISEVEVMEGQLVELPCEARGVPAPELKWMHNGKMITEARKYIDEYGLRFVANLTDFGEYTCIASNNYGNTSIKYTVLIWVSPSIEPPLEVLDDVQSGTNVSFECNAIGFPIPTIKWAFRGDILNYSTTDLSFNDSGNLHIHNASSKNEGPYVCIAENIVGMAKKNFYLSINEIPTILEDDYTGPYVASNLDTVLAISCKVAGRPKPYIAWIKDGYYLDKDSRYNIDLDGTLTMKDLSEELSGVYTCVAKNSAGNATRDVPVKIYSMPVVMQDESAPTLTTAVEGTNVIVQCPVRGNDYDVKWYKDALLISTNGTLSFPNVSRTNESTYTCVASNAVGSVYTNVVLQVQWKPSLLSNETEIIEVVKGDDYYLDCNTDAKPRAKTKWLFNSKLLLGENKDVLKLLHVLLRHSGVYKCIANNEHGTRHKQFDLRVLEPPFISEFELLDVELKAGANATLECNASGTPRPNVLWIFNNTNWIVRNSRLISKNVSSQSEGIYRCEASNKAGIAHVAYRVIVVSSARIEDVVFYKDGVGTNVDDSLDLILNTNIRLACKATGNPRPIIQWIRHGNIVGENIDGINYADLMLSNISASHAGSYSCIVSNEGGIEEKSIKVNVFEPPRIFQTLFQNANTSQNIIELEVISGQAFYMHCHLYGNPLPAIYWFKDLVVASQVV